MKIAGIVIEVLIEYTELFMQGAKTIETRNDILIEQRNQLVAKVEDIKKTINKLNNKIEVHKSVILKKELLNMEERTRHQKFF